MIALCSSLRAVAAPHRAVVLRAPELAGWVFIGAMAVTTAVFMSFKGLSFDWPSAAKPAAACFGLLVGAMIYRTWRPDERIAASLAAVAQLIAFSSVAVSASYAIASIGGPLWDDAFMSWDKSIGLDWRAYLDAVDAHPRLALVYGLAYQSLMIQIIVAAAVLGLSGRPIECRTFVLSFILAGLVTVVVSGLMPALSVFAHLGLRAGDYRNIDATAAFSPLVPLTGLRTGSLRVISLDHAEGIIAFPSFHAVLGVMFIRAFWFVRSLRWPALLLNLALIASTPINGGHYFVDVIAGALIAVFAIAAARRLDAFVANRTPFAFARLGFGGAEAI